MIVCLDTNTLLQAREPAHRYFPILDALVAGRLYWAISNRVLTEYEEIVTASAGAKSWVKLSRLIELISLTTDTIIHVSPHYQFHVITGDLDDNAFTDCAIAANADYVITEDRHFSGLATAGYRPKPITPADFIARYRGIHL